MEVEVVDEEGAAAEEIRGGGYDRQRHDIKNHNAGILT